MAPRTVAFELPEDLVALLGSLEEVTAQAKQAFVLDLLRQAHISQGKAAELLGISRYDILDLMVEHQIPSGPVTEEDLRQELDVINFLAREREREQRDRSQ